jgi:hypothetical protein
MPQEQSVKQHIAEVHFICDVVGQNEHAERSRAEQKNL